MKSILKRNPLKNNTTSVNYAESYLKKHTKGLPYIQEPPSKGLKYIVTIPAYIETRLIESLVSLFSCVPPSFHVEVIVAINWPENDSPENRDLSLLITENVKSWIEKNTSGWINFQYIILPDVPARVAGVGYARKEAMDEAVRRFREAGQQDGIIISFDGDTICDSDYFTALESHFNNNPDTDGCTVYFEHPCKGDLFPEVIYKGIMQYELHLRYYLSGLRYTGFPNAFFTVGSAFAVRERSYCQQGGMNTRKAGEDFYFLQKLFDLGKFSELNTTRVIPSPRPSLRVPFGTGASISAFINGENSINSYNPELFEILKKLFEKIPVNKEDELKIININPVLNSFLESSGFYNSMEEIRQNSAGISSFRKRFFRYFNMFRILKFLNYSREFYPDIPVSICAQLFLRKTGYEYIPDEPENLLEIFRIKDRGIIPQQ